jgi:hypothetical protein
VWVSVGGCGSVKVVLLAGQQCTSPLQTGASAALCNSRQLLPSEHTQCVQQLSAGSSSWLMYNLTPPTGAAYKAAAHMVCHMLGVCCLAKLEQCTHAVCSSSCV